MNIASAGHSVIKRTVSEFLFIVLAVLVMFIASAHFEPLIISTTLSPDGREQGGWPLPFSSSYWDDMGMKSYQAGHFDFGAFLVDALIFYVLIRFVVAVLEGVIHRYDSQQYKELMRRIAKRIAVMTVFLCLVYGAYVLWVSIMNVPQEVFPLNL